MDITAKLELNRAIATIETLGRELPTEEAYELYRHLGTRQEILRKRLSREGVFKQTSVQGRGVVLLSAVEAVKVG